MPWEAVSGCRDYDDRTKGRMMAKYGIPYLGSKSAIAEDIISSLPGGNRLVDLFGGGFSISHCALLSYKWKRVLYNDINPLLIPLIRDAIAGNYSYEKFLPKWISREEFNEKKDIDGYIKWCWSFGNDGASYLYGKDVEDLKHAGHDYCVYGKPIEGFDLPEIDGISKRRLALNAYIEMQHFEATERFGSLEHIEHLQRLERIQSLEALERLERLEMTCMDYREYKYQDGDVVYCDIPYQNNSGKKDYGGDFDFGAFYQWAVSRPYPVYFSSYKLGGIVWERDKSVLKDPTSHDKVRREVLYCVHDDFEEPEKIYQGNFFERLI